MTVPVLVPPASPAVPPEIPSDLASGVPLEQARAIHLNLQEMVKLSDQKAQAFVAIGSVLTALLGSNAIDRFRAVAGVSASPLLLAAGSITLTLLVAAVLSAVAVLQPRFPGAKLVEPVSDAPRLLWASDIAKYTGTPDDYFAALSKMTAQGALADVAYENLKISALLAEKWKWSRCATWFLRGGIAAWAVTVVLAVVGA